MINGLISATMFQIILYVAIGIGSFCLVAALVRLTYYLATKNRINDDEEYDDEYDDEHDGQRDKDTIVCKASKKTSLVAVPKTANMPKIETGLNKQSTGMPNMGGKKEFVIKIVSGKAEDNITKKPSEEKNNISSTTRRDVFDRIEFMIRDTQRYTTVPYYRDKTEDKTAIDLCLCGERVFAFILDSDCELSNDNDDAVQQKVKTIHIRLDDVTAQEKKQLKLTKSNKLDGFYQLCLSKCGFKQRKELYQLFDLSYDFVNSVSYEGKPYDDIEQAKLGIAEQQKLIGLDLT